MALESNEVVEQGPAPSADQSRFDSLSDVSEGRKRAAMIKRVAVGLRVFANDAAALARAWPPPCLQAINDAEHAMPLARLMNSATLL